MTQHVRVRPGALARALALQDMSLSTLAAEAGISKALAGFLKQETTGTSLDKAERIAAALNLPVGELFEHKNGDQIANVTRCPYVVYPGRWYGAAPEPAEVCGDDTYGAEYCPAHTAVLDGDPDAARDLATGR